MMNKEEASELVREMAAVVNAKREVLEKDPQDLEGLKALDERWGELLRKFKEGWQV